MGRGAGREAWGLERGRLVGVGRALVVIPSADARESRVDDLLGVRGMSG
jgi:hypothetical protein